MTTNAPAPHRDTPTTTAVQLSVVIPVYNEVDSLRDLSKAILAALDATGMTSEAIFVDDGSTDGSDQVLRDLVEEDARVQAVFLARNYGQTAAMSAGFEATSGELIVSMDGDGQNDPADIPALIAKLDEGFDVVSGWRKKRQDPLLTRRIPSRIANRLAGWITGLRLHDYGCSLKIYRREFVEDIRLYGEFHRFIPVFAEWQGARIGEVKVNHHPRTRGTSKYGLERTLKVLLDLLLLRFMGRYSTRPAHFSGIGALVSAALSVLIFAFVAIRWTFFAGEWVSPAIIVSFFLMGVAVQFTLFGLLAEMIMRTYYESQDLRPYRIRQHLRRQPPARA